MIMNLYEKKSLSVLIQKGIDWVKHLKCLGVILKEYDYRIRKDVD